jgi:hypothetical protein
MKGDKYLRLLERWEFINDLSLEEAIKEIKPSVLESLLKEWGGLQEASLKTDDICNKSPEIPMIPVSSTVDLNPDLIANIALYSDKQIIPDPIDIALDKTEDPLENTAGFLFYLKEGMEDMGRIKPLLQENLVEIIPYRLINSLFPTELKAQLTKDWFEYKSIKYLNDRTKKKLYINDNVLAFQVGDANAMPFERFADMGGKVLEETNESITFPSIVPHDLNGIDSGRIEKWMDNMFHITANRAANRINQRLVVAELFSGSIASNEIVTYGFIKRKCFNQQSSKGILDPIHNIPILGKINLEKFIDFRSNELPSFVSFRQEWNEGRGLFKEEISSETWMNNLNRELDKCKAEIDKNKKKIFGKIVEDFAWAGLGVAAGVFSGNLLNPAIMTTIPSLVRDIKNAATAYYEMKRSYSASSPFFLLNVIDRRTNNVKTDIPLDLPERMPFDLNKMFSRLNGAPMKREVTPDGKYEYLTV